jgi:hypothetical protein
MVDYTIEECFQDYANIQGQFGIMASSFEVVIKHIFDSLGEKTPASFGQKLKKLKKIFANSQSNQIKAGYEKLISELEQFNETWNIVKHGNFVGNRKPLTLLKDNKAYSFDNTSLDKIKNNFTQTQKTLMELSSQLKTT